MDLTVLGDTLWEDGHIRPARIQIERGKIAAIQQQPYPPNLSTRICQAPPGGVVAPGFIDIQINGAFGHDFTASRSGVMEVARKLPQFGVTSFLPTVITSPLDNMRAAVSEIKLLIEESKDKSAEILGLHFEGPYVAPSKGGAHNRNYMIAPSSDHLSIFDPSVVRLLTLAPELSGAQHFIAEVARRGIVVGLGHCEATYEQTIGATESGATWGTHLFNGMPPLSHREPGIVTALLTESRLGFGLIADGLHTHPAILKLAYLAKGRTGITLISDAISATGMPPGDYFLGDVAIVVDGSSSRTRQGGGLAGSVLTLDAAVKNMQKHAGCSLADALLMATSTPASVLGLSNKGRLSVGADADIVILDESGAVDTTIARGNMVYQRSTAER